MKIIKKSNQIIIDGQGDTVHISKGNVGIEYIGFNGDEPNVRNFNFINKDKDMELLIEYIDSKIELEIIRTQVDSEGYGETDIDLRNKVDELKSKILTQ